MWDGAASGGCVRVVILFWTLVLCEDRHGNWPRIRGFPLGKKCPPKKIKWSAQIRM